MEAGVDARSGGEAAADIRIREDASRDGLAGAVQTQLRRHPLVAFFVLAFAITWMGQIAALALAEQHGLVLSNEENFLHLQTLIDGRLVPAGVTALALFTLGTAGPLLSALVMTWVGDGSHGLWELWGRIVNWRVAPRWYVVVLALPVVMASLSVAAGALAGGVGLDALAPRLAPAAFVPFFLYLMVFTGLAEEPGWRGFALPRLQHHYSPVKASWILGALWGLWHFPFMAYYNREAGPAALVPLLIMLVLGIVGWTIVNTWIYNRTASVFLLILLHGWGNAVQSYLVLGFPHPLSWTLYSLLPWALAIILMRVGRGAYLAPSPDAVG